MVDIQITGDRVTLAVKGAHQLWAFKRRIEFPRAAIRAVHRLPDDALRGWWKGIRAPGTQLPGVFIAGTFYTGGERHFWDVRDASHAIEIDLDGQRYQRLFVEVADPDAALRELTTIAGDSPTT
jgi:hypothetical protein